jgi:hypothetical protein
VSRREGLAERVDRLHMKPVRPSPARLVVLLLAACLAASAMSSYESAANWRSTRGHQARTLRGGLHGQARLPGIERTRRLGSVAPELRQSPHPETAIQAAAVTAPSFAPLPAVQSSDRSPARCRST